MAYVYRDGSRLTPWMLYVVNRFSEAMYAAHGVRILVTSGIRTYDEQRSIFLSRYTTSPGGRRVYDTRVWNGVRWYRVSPAGTVAVPGTSNHEVQGGRAAVDLRDTGANAGITSANNARSNWARANAARYGLVASGYGFGEPWHFDIPNINNTPPASPAGQEESWNMATADQVLAAVNNLTQIIVGTGASIDDPKWSPGPNSVMGTTRNIAAHLYAGGPSATDPNYLGAPGTLYSLAKAPVTRVQDGKAVKIAQIQDNADTNSMVRQLLDRPAVSVTEAQVRAIADAIVKSIGQPKVEIDAAAIAKAVNDEHARRLGQKAN